MRAPLTPTFKSWLETHRSTLNKLFEVQKALFPSLDQEKVLDLIQNQLQSYALKKTEINTEQHTNGLYVLYQTGLSLMGRGLWDKYPIFAKIWNFVLPNLSLFDQYPHEALQKLVNAAYNLSFEKLNTSLWLLGIQRTAHEVHDLKTLETAIVVMAWRSGIVWYRETALAAVAELPESVARALLEVPEAHSLAFILENLKRSVWFRSETGQYDEHWDLGGFSGFDGQFLNPPEITTLQNVLLAKDSENIWEVYADCYGQQFVKFEGAWPGSKTLADPGILEIGNKRLRIRSFPNASTAALTKHFWAITLPNSHHIFLLRPPFDLQ